MSKLTDEIRDQVTAVIESGLSDEAFKSMRKKVADITCDIEDDLMYRLKEDLANNLSAFVAEMAGKVVGAILEGNEDQMRRYLSCQESGWTGRTGSPFSYRAIAEMHPVIHGKLFEQGCILLRRKIVEAHRDLITEQRILDLEDQVASLVAQVNKANADREEILERAYR